MRDFILREAELADEPVLLEFEQKVVEAERSYNSAIKSGDVFYYDLPACLLYTSPSPRDLSTSRMPSSA